MELCCVVLPDPFSTRTIYFATKIWSKSHPIRCQREMQYVSGEPMMMSENGREQLVLFTIFHFSRLVTRQGVNSIILTVGTGKGFIEHHLSDPCRLSSGRKLEIFFHQKWRTRVLCPKSHQISMHTKSEAERHRTEWNEKGKTNFKLALMVSNRFQRANQKDYLFRFVSFFVFALHPFVATTFVEPSHIEQLLIIFISYFACDDCGQVWFPDQMKFNIEMKLVDRQKIWKRKIMATQFCVLTPSPSPFLILLPCPHQSKQSN